MEGREMYIKIFLSTILFVLSFTTNIFALGDISLGSGTFPIYINGVDNMLVNGVKDSEGDMYISGSTEIAEYFHDVKEGFKIGGRLENATTGRVKCRNNLEIKANPNDVDGNCEASLNSVMLGGSYNESISDKININSKLFFGYGRANFKSEFSLRENRETIDSKKINKDADCFIVEVSLGIQHFFTKTKTFGVGFDIGYRYMPKVILSEGIELSSLGWMSRLSLIYKI
jgi:hypothetical protein